MIYQVIKDVVSDFTLVQDSLDDNKGQETVVLENLHKSLSLDLKPIQTGKRTNSVYVKHFGSSISSRTVMGVSDNQSSHVWKKKGSVTMESGQLAELFRLRPELSEYIYMEIKNAKLTELN